MKLDASTIRLVLKLTTLKHFAEYFDRQKDKPFRSRLGNWPLYSMYCDSVPSLTITFYTLQTLCGYFLLDTRMYNKSSVREPIDKPTAEKRLTTRPPMGGDWSLSLLRWLSRRPGGGEVGECIWRRGRPQDGVLQLQLTVSRCQVFDLLLQQLHFLAHRKHQVTLNQILLTTGSSSILTMYGLTKIWNSQW